MINASILRVLMLIYKLLKFSYSLLAILHGMLADQDGQQPVIIQRIYVGQCFVISQSVGYLLLSSDHKR